MFFEDVQAYVAIAVYVGMKHFGSKSNLGWLERVIRWEMDGHKENATRIWTVVRAYDGCLPVEHVFSYRTCAA